MKPWTAWAIAYAATCGAVAVACYITSSAWPLLALVLIPTIKASEGDQK